jgi:molybdopterin converting factor small subunit
MAQATVWFSSPFKEWMGQRSLTVSWEGTLRLRDLWERLAGEYPKLRANLPREGLQEEAMSHLAAVIVEGDILTLDAEIKDGAKVDVLTPLSGGTRQGQGRPTARSDRDSDREIREP